MTAPPRDLPRLQVRGGRLPRVRSGHPWVFSNELESVPRLDPGTLVEVASGDELLGTAYFNPASLIALRWLQRGTAPLQDDWLERRLAAAVAARRGLYPGDDCARLVFSEADGLPGLVVDRYGDALVVQVHTAGMERLRPRLEASLRALLNPRVLARRDDAPVRELEGLPRGSSLEPEGAPAPEATYLGLRFRPDLLGAQKTGLFLDQRENVQALLSLLPPGARVLDVFSYAGAWGLSALRAGAAAAEFVDASRPACEAVEENLRLNGLPECEIHCGDAFEVLGALRREGREFDAVVVDPPAFAKSKKHLPEALQAYRRINRLAAGLVRPGGLLAACSCSHHVSREAFREVLQGAMAKAGREARLLAFRGASADHPVLLNFPEGDYLKCALLRLA